MPVFIDFAGKGRHPKHLQRTANKNIWMQRRFRSALCIAYIGQASKTQRIPSLCNFKNLWFTKDPKRECNTHGGCLMKHNDSKLQRHGTPHDCRQVTHAGCLTTYSDSELQHHGTPHGGWQVTHAGCLIKYSDSKLQCHGTLHDGWQVKSRHLLRLVTK